MATSIAAFEPVIMVCDPEQESEVRRYYGFLGTLAVVSWPPGRAPGKR